MYVYKANCKLYTNAENAVYAAIKAAGADDYYSGLEIQETIRSAKRGCTTVIFNYNDNYTYIRVEKIEVA